ncbi:NAD-dependent epimerase/dehydratase family protein [Streptosporangium sp. NPDC000396]|uniref:NAD-dependent epimerase/dehydratase family protein n=1 Tax=Streptosporangium sp. NPDC000396 TaxID=3366185 RepID=UPI0036CFF62E
MVFRKLSGVVMTHPSRRAMAERLLHGQAGGWLDLVTDPEPHGSPHPLRTAMRAWSAVPSGASHHLVLQDDAQLTSCFLDRVRETIELLPDAALALYANWNSRNGAMVRMGALAGARLALAANEYTPLVALVLPAKVASGFEEYARRHGRGWSDDITMQRYLKISGVPTYLAVPNLVEHGDVVSLAQNDAHGLRRSACFSAVEVSHRHSGIEHRLDATEAIPFFKKGVSYCAVRIPAMADQTWETVSCESYLRRLGIAVPARDFTGTGRLPGQVLRGVWMTAFAMGILRAQAVCQGKDSCGDTASSDAVLDLALGTIGPGGLCDSLPAATLEETAAELRSLAWAGLVEGLNFRRGTATKRARTARRVVSHPNKTDRRILVTGGGRSPLAEYLTRGLADSGLAVLSWDIEPIGQGHPGITVIPPSASVEDVRHLFSATTAVVFLNGLTDFYGERQAWCRSPRWGLLGHAMAAGIRKLVCCSTQQVYGDLPVPADEETPFVSLAEPFAAAAWAGESICRSISDRSDALTQVVRFATPYGPGVLPRHPPGSFICQALRGEPIEYAGQADQQVQLVHVDDMAQALRAVVLSTSTTPVLNIGSVSPTTVGELAKMVTGLVKAVPARFANAAPETGASGVVCTDRMSDDLGFQTAVPIADGIRSYAQWLAYDDVSWQWR